MSDDEDYCPEEQEKEAPEDKAIGPKCDVCHCSTESLYPVLVKRERRGLKEMVQIYLCAFHYIERMEEDALPPPPDEVNEENIGDLWHELMGPDGEEEEEEDDDDNNEGWNSTTTDCIGQSFG